jgi:hypothetical protein
MVKSVRKFGITLVVNDLSFVTNCPFFNSMLVSLIVEQFLGSMDTTGYQKTMQY